MVNRFLLVAVAASLFTLLVVAAAKNTSEDFYAILGIPRSASTKEIKSAYRRKARDTHPDKNRDVPAEEAAAEFHRVVHAFEVLSDSLSRQRYDVWGEDSTGGGSSSSSSPPSSHWQSQFFQQRRRTVHLNDTFEVKQAQSRVIHIVSLDQLRTIMLDDNDRLERHLLLCFFTPSIESVVNDDIVFPYPFAGMSPQSIWWEDILQTASIRFYRSNELTRYFNIGSGDEMTEPVFVFAKRGAMLGEILDREDTNFFVYKTKDRESFVTWMWGRMEVKVIFHNKHAHPVEMYWISGNRAHIKVVIEPESSWIHYSMLTHEFYARDARVDAWSGSPGGWKLTPNSSLGSWKIGVEGEDGSPPIREDGSLVIDIPSKFCLDLSGHCQFWASQDQCRENPTFMREKCMLTCGHCSEAQEDQTCEN